MKASVKIFEHVDIEFYRLTGLLMNYRRAVKAWEEGYGGNALKNNKNYWSTRVDDWIIKHEVKEEK
jgi:hypothetical protein